MFSKIVKATLFLNGEHREYITISITLSCVPTTPDEELIRRAGNILRAAATNATYKVI